jgi:hypothetical protein
MSHEHTQRTSGTRGRPRPRRRAAVTPSDSTILNCRAIYVGGAGNVAVTLADSNGVMTCTAVL